MTLTLIGSVLDYGSVNSDSDDFDITGINEVVALFDGVSQPGEFGVRLSSDGGSTFPATSGDYLRSSFTDNAGEASAAATNMRLSFSAAGSTGAAGVLCLTRLQNEHRAFGWISGNHVAGANIFGMAFHKTKAASVGPFNALRVISPAGNLTAGKLRLYQRTGTLVQIGSTLNYASTPSASNDFDITGADDVLILYEGVTHPGSFGVRLSDDGGSTFKDTSGNYLRSACSTAAKEANTSDTMFRLGALSRTASHGIAEFFGLQAPYPAHMIATGSETTAAPGTQHDRTSGSVVGPFNRLRVICPTGNMTAGKLRVFKRA